MIKKIFIYKIDKYLFYVTQCNTERVTLIKNNIELQIKTLTFCGTGVLRKINGSNILVFYQNNRFS